MDPAVELPLPSLQKFHQRDISLSESEYIYVVNQSPTHCDVVTKPLFLLHVCLYVVLQPHYNVVIISTSNS